MRIITYLFLICVLTGCDNFYKHLVLVDGTSNNKTSIIYENENGQVLLKSIFSKDRHSLKSKQDVVLVEIVSNLDILLIDEDTKPEISLILNESESLKLKVLSNTKKRLNYYADIPERTEVNYSNIRVEIQLPPLIVVRDTIESNNFIFQYTE